LGRKRDPDRPRAPLTRLLLAEHAAWYLERWWPSARRLEQVLARKGDRHATSDEERAQARAWAHELVAERVARGNLDDRRFAKAWVEEMHRKGLSRRGMLAKLREKGVDGDTANAAVGALDAEVGPDAERVRAVAYARRRRLGPMRHDPEKRAERRHRDLGALARAGFSYGIAKAVVDADDLDDLLEQY
jgi:regulatory protein